MPKLSKRTLILYALCNLGWSLAFYNVNNQLNYFYLPNLVGGQSMFAGYLPRTSFFLGLTILGLIIGSGRIIDAITDPIIANMSDRSKNKLGKRRSFMLFASLPLALFGFLAFYPPFNSVTINNAFYVMVILVLYYISLTMYVVPCSALVGELGHSAKDRLNLSTASSVGWALGFMTGNMIFLLQGIFENMSYSSDIAFQIAIATLSIISFVFLFFPAYFIKESNEHSPSEAGLFSSLRVTFKNNNFRVFLIAEMSYWFALTFIQMGISYYIITLLNLEKEFATVAMMIVFLNSFVFYVPVNFLARKIGKKKTEMIGFVVLAIGYSFVLFLGQVDLAPRLQIIIVSLVASVPMAIFGIMPFAIIGDIAEKDGIDTGNYKIGTFYAFRGLFMKIGTSLAGLIFPTVIMWGTSQVTTYGIRMTGVFGIVFCIIGFMFMTMYKDHIIE